MRLLLLTTTLLVIVVRTRGEDSEEPTNREIADVDYYDQRDHDMVIARAFGPSSIGGVRDYLFIYLFIYLFSFLHVTTNVTMFCCCCLCSLEFRNGRIRW